MVEAILAVVRDVEVFPSVIVVVANADALPPSGCIQSGLDGYIAESAIVIIAIKMVGRTLACGEAFQRRAIHKEDVGPAVIVVVKDRGAAAGRFDNVFLRLLAAKDDGRGQAGFLGDVGEIGDGSLGRLCLRRNVQTAKHDQCYPECIPRRPSEAHKENLVM